MRLARFSRNTKESYGFVTDNGIVDLPALAKQLHRKLPSRFNDFLASGIKESERAETFMKDTTAENLEHLSSPIDRVKLLAPVSRPGKIVCLGLNYRDHAAEQNASIPDDPVIFMKPSTSMIGPNENIVKPHSVQQLDYEAELAIVVGMKTKCATRSEAKSCILGYMILNDVSARDIQFKDRQWTRGKSCDTFAPTGPWILTRQQLGDPSDLRIRTWVDGELRQDSTTRNMIFDVYEIIHRLSETMTLEPGDIISSGTPAGVGFAMKPQPKFLQRGSLVRIEIEKIGVLENRVVQG